MIVRKEFLFPANAGGHELYGCIWMQEERPYYKGVVQIAHGMEEHILRYQGFAVFLADHGFIVCGNDHMGHGRSVTNLKNRGFFGEKPGSYQNLIEDMRYLMEFTKKRFPELPYFLLGHSMGSFLGREFIAQYPGRLTGFLCLGTSAGSPFIDAAILLSEIGVKEKGAHKKAYHINQLAFGTFNHRFEPKKTEYDWLSSDSVVVKRFIEDVHCGFVFPYAGYRELFMLLKKVSSADWAARVEKHLPMLFLSGMDDPVGDYGKGVPKVVKWLRDAGCEHVTLRMYAHGRHELLNEVFRRQVYRVILKWLHETIGCDIHYGKC